MEEDHIRHHEVPPTSSDEPMHELSDECWCLPKIEPVESDTGEISFIITHNRITEEKNGPGAQTLGRH